MFRRGSRLQSLALWLALAGVLLRAAVPFGYMPGWMQADSHGASGMLVLCSASDHSALASSAATPPSGEDGDDLAKLQAGCAFALAAATGLPPAVPAAGFAALASIAPPSGTRPAAPQRAPAALPPPRGPPAVLRIG